MIETAYNPNEFPAQGSFNPKVDYPSADLIEQYRASERGDHRAIAALLTIERENAAAADTLPLQSTSLEAAAAPPVPPPAIATSGYADDGLPPDFEASAVVPAHVARDAVAAAQRGKAIVETIRKASRTKERKPPARSYSRKAPLKRPARARAVHSHSAHGGARKAADDGDGGPSTPGSQSGGDYGIWGNAKSYAAAKRCGFLDPIPKPRPGYTFVNAACECWRRQFSKFCTNCTPVVRREVPLTEALS
jgi:hypothetical protein